MDQFQANRIRLASVFEDTMRRIRESEELRWRVGKSIQEQTFIGERDTINSPKARYEEAANIKVTTNRTFEAAARYKGMKVAALNFASSSNPGGGVTSGARAQEESLCRVSTLYPCLVDRKMMEMFYYPHRISHNPLHNDDIIYTPNVCVIKDDNYNILDEPFLVDVITCAAPNLRSTPDGYISNDELFLLHKQRARRIVQVAANNNVDVLILGAFGCGAFRNDPEVVAKAYKEVATEYQQHFKEIEFAVFCRNTDATNYHIFADIIG